MEVLLYGIVGDAADKLDAKTLAPQIRAATSPITLRINSPGGYVMEGLAIVAAIRECRVKVTAIVDGLAASMASVIAAASDECLMAEASMLMVHNPWDVAIGDAPELRAAADKLDRIRDQLVAIYGKRSGIEAPELMRMLDAETWLDAAQAVDLGFADGITPDLKIAACAVGAFGFRHTPDRLKDSTVTGTPTPSPTPALDTAQAVAQERTRISTIMALGTKHRLPESLTNDLVSRGLALSEARAAILDHLAAEGDRASIGHTHGSGGGHVTLDNPSTYGAAIQAAMVAKIGGTEAEGPAAEFRGMSVVDMARDFLSRNGERDVHRISPDRVLNMAMRPGAGSGRQWGFTTSAAITHTTSDFPDLVGGAAQTFLMERYKRQQSQLKLLARKRNRRDFLVQSGVQMSGFGTLDRVGEAGEFKNKTITSRKEGWKIDTYGNMFNVSRQMLINDQLGALSDILTVMAGAAAELEATILATLINQTMVMSDGKPVFDATHGNLAATGAAPSIDTLDAGRLAMRRQKDMDGVGLIDANPKYLLVPVGLQTKAETLVSSTVSPTTAAEVNPVAGKLETVADPRLTNNTAWYLFADPEFSPSLEYGYLDGQEAPFTDSQDGWRVDGVEYKVRHDFGGGWMDYRMAYKNPGA